MQKYEYVFNVEKCCRIWYNIGMKDDKNLSKEELVALKIRINALRKNERLVKMAKRAVKTEKFQVIFANADDFFMQALKPVYFKSRGYNGEFCFSEKELISDTKEFFAMLDGYAEGDYSFLEKVEENLQYLELHKNDPNYRSRVSPISQKIRINSMGYADNLTDFVHEFTHSMAPTFSKELAVLPHYKNLIEICPLFCEKIALNVFLPTKYPGLKRNIVDCKISAENSIRAALIQTEIEGLLVKILAGEMSVNEVVNKYYPIFKEKNIKQKSAVNFVLKRFENADKVKKGNNPRLIFGESQYYFCNIIACYLFEKWQENPQKMTEQFKTILANDGLWSPEIFHGYLRADFDEMYKDYLINYQRYIDELCHEQQQIRDSEIEQLK